MENREKILISKEIIDKIKAGLHTIRLTTKEKSIQKEAATLVKLLEAETNMDSLSLEEKILQKMKETKSTDPDMNANLYILHRKLVNGQISEQQALELFEAYVRTDNMNNGFY
ncbi:hypothetical protein [Clostridium magnum]|uniref:Uncharacterized protein n=1 Tax=Clostridium magnum DSM 2767 TaxID=1121326 RepID=A0A162UNW4_9CLOT|nr:hypothetical protein [Clostridium magnum]KZL94125.1 hypothetical protein CLMAG_11780 [Clostridium magnum DSM 2767]SHH94591.1 hypothetical protein SAMN02745944_01875 [Clostridium magnum DSM 2767]